MADLTNKTLGNFRIRYTLGTGGMGTVYKARDTMLNIDVAIKVMHPQFAQQKEFQQRFQQEARSAAAVKHPNIVGVRYLGEEGSHLYMVMEYISGDDLRKRLNRLVRKGERLLLEEALQLVQIICQAIGHAHQSGVIHRDIKPANIMLQPDEQSAFGYQPIITDLGLAKIVGMASVTQAEGPMGTPAYMSPEQVLGPRKSVGAASDIYTLGVLLFELVTSAPPFVTNSISEIVQYHTNESVLVPDLKALRPDLSAEVNWIIRKALMRKPEERFASAQEMAFALEEALRQVILKESAVHPAVEETFLWQEDGGLKHEDSEAEPAEQNQVEKNQVETQRIPDRIQIMLPAGDLMFMDIHTTPLTVGREEDNLLSLSNDPKLSRYHAQVEYENETFFVTDNNSTNGVYLGERLLPPNERVEWPKGTTIRIGTHQLLILSADITGIKSQDSATSNAKNNQGS